MKSMVDKILLQRADEQTADAFVKTKAVAKYHRMVRCANLDCPRYVMVRGTRGESITGFCKEHLVRGDSK